MGDLQQYKCPACGGAVEFDSSIQKMKCPFCDSVYDVSFFEPEATAEGAKEDVKINNSGFESEAAAWTEGETNGMVTFVCQSCGGEIIGDANMGATKCPYCDNQVVVKGQFEGALRPEYIIPFKLDKKAAKEKLKNHLSNKKFLPPMFKDDNHIDEIQGVYVPFWLFDADVTASINYQATKVRRWREGDYRCEEISYFHVHRDGRIAFDRIPADGSSKMDDTLMESIEPFRFEDAVPFQTAYMAGYVADKYDVEASQLNGRINERIKTSTEQNFRQTVHNFDSVVTTGSHINVANGKTHYVLYPAWILNTTWEGKKYVFAMNGQTGKFVGDLPMDKKAFAKSTALIGTILGLVGFAIRCMIFFA